MINRGALILRYKEPAVRWINDADPAPNPSRLTIEQVNEERTVYLVDDAVGDSPQALERWLKKSYVALFELELEGWYTDPDLWPRDRSYRVFREWFDVELHTMLLDLGSGEIVDDGT